MIYLWLDGIPPSSNHAYFNLPKGGRTLTKVGKKYLSETKMAIVQNFQQEIAKIQKNKPYLLVIRFYLEKVENAGFFKGMAETRYKRIDVTNRVKLLEDALKDALGVDDSQNLRVILDKQQGKERTEIWLWDLEEEETPFDVGFNALSL